MCETTQDRALAVSIVIPCRDEKDHIASCLHSILAQVPPLGGFEVIVADGMSGDGTGEILRRLAEEHACLRIVENPGRIVSTGLNTAIRVAQGRIIIRMDVHTEYAPDYICECLAVLQETDADNVGGPWLAKAEGFVGRAIARAFQSPFAVGDRRGHNASYEGRLDTVYLGCWHREVFDKIGFFDEELVRNQDDELNLRLTRAGGKIWQSPRIRSWYSPRESLSALFRQYAQYGYWKVRVIQKHRIPTSVRHLIPASFVLLLTVLPLVSLVWPRALWGWLGLLGIYVLCSLSISLRIAAGKEWNLFPILALVFACFHVAYGYGFLRGLWDFVILQRGAHRTYTELTRPSTRLLSRDTTID